jgi:hypothetical protein
MSLSAETGLRTPEKAIKKYAPGGSHSISSDHLPIHMPDLNLINIKQEHIKNGPIFC